MDHNNSGWYPPQNRPQHPQQRSQSQRGQQQHQDTITGRVDPVQNAQALLAVHPLASATPTAHVARYMRNMSTPAPPATYMQPNYYTPYPQGNPPPYSEYAQEVHYLSSQNAPVNDGGYWEATRNASVHLLREQPASSFAFQNPLSWDLQQHPTSFQSTPFAQSVFQHALPTSAYPTPPPPGIATTSSSLAFALGGQPIRSQSTSSQTKVPRSEESTAFFNNFLNDKTRALNMAADVPPRTVTPPPKAIQAAPQESPDPLALTSGAPNTPHNPITPRKRKPVVELESPSIKRIQSIKSSHGIPVQPPTITPRPAIPTTPSSASSSNSKFSTPKRVRMAYVEVPVKPWLTPTSSHKSGTPMLTDRQRGKSKVEDTPDDLGGYGSEGDIDTPSRARALTDSVKVSGRRTGDRDERAPLEKLVALFEDTFEAEDSLPPDGDLDTHDFFSALTTDPNRPLLNSSFIRKLTKYIGHVSRPAKRVRQAGGGVSGTPRGKGRMADLETTMLSRILKILERSVKLGEDVDPFPSDGPLGSASTTKASPRKASTKRPVKGKKGKASMVGDEEESRQDEEIDAPPVDAVKTLDDVDFERLTRTLNLARDSILAADCCMALLGSDRLTKQLYSEELITACLSAVKNQLTKIIYPFVEVSAETGTTNSISSLLLHVVRNTSPTSQGHRHQISEIFQALSAVLPRINLLVNAETVSMSDSIIIQAVYIAIGPFFVVEAGGDDAKGKKDNVVLRTFGKSAMRGLRLDALSLIRSIFANHEDQRSWIIEEILSSLIKLSDTKQKAGQFRLRDGHSIRTVSALLLQLVQTSAHDVRIEAKNIQKARQNKFALRRQESFSESQTQGQEAFMDEHDVEETRLYASGLESAMKAAKSIILFLTQRSGKGKATKNTNEAEYRTIFDNLISDLLAVLYWPEWPAASLLLGIACKFMVSSLDDVKSTSQTDNNAARTMALDHLGVIAARIRSTTLKIQDSTSDSNPTLKPMDELTTSLALGELDRLLACHRDVALHLCKRSSEDQAYDSARELTAAIVGHELALSIRKVHASIEGGDEDLNIKDQTKLIMFGQRLKKALREVWTEPQTDIFDIGTPDEVIRIDRLSEEIGTIQSLRNSFQPILAVILGALDAPAIFMRTKALRALGQIVTSDATILSAPNVRNAIESHLLDSSPAVRDAAVELIGKYMIDAPEVASEYYQKIADRIADTGLSVRKRVIKLLKSFYSVTPDASRRIDISTRMVLRMMDEDDSVKELAMKSMEELWFSGNTPQPSGQTKGKPHSSGNREKAALLAKAAVIMGTSANFKDRQSPLEDMLHKIMADKDGAEAATLHARYTEICGVLIDGLVDASDLPGFTVINCIRSIYLFTSAYPAILSGSNASTLLPYLKNSSNAEEQATPDYLLKIFRASIPHMPKTAVKFGQELQSALQPMIIKPSNRGVQVLQETVACMCIVVQNLTHDFIRLINLVKSCNARIQQMIKRPATQELADNDVRALLILIFIVALLAEHCDFDRLRVENQALASDINTISQGSVIEHIYNSLLQLYDKYDTAILRGKILQCLGFLFRAQPTLMTKDRSSVIMDAIFASPEEEARSRILKIIQEFLLSEAAKHTAKEKENTKGKPKTSAVNMEELVGNTDGFADSGVSSAIVQRYLVPILDAALSKHPQIQQAAIDVLSFTIKQGLAHPLQSFPVIVALETSPNPHLSNRASALHAILHGKHASLLNTRYTVSARTSYDYQKKVSSPPIRGFRMQPTPVALLQRWYSLVRDKRPTRQDFLKSLVKVFQENPSYQASQDDVEFTRYMAENFSAFEYKTQEEVFTVIKNLTTVLSTTGTQLLEIISPSHLLTHLHSNLPPQSDSSDATKVADPEVASMDVDSSTPPVAPAPSKNEEPDHIGLMRTSVIISMVMLLKAHLKALYSLSEDKCNKFIIGKKSAIGDKAAVKRHDLPISWDRLPFATNCLLTSQDADLQKTRFLDIWNEDGVLEEPDDDLP